MKIMIPAVLAMTLASGAVAAQHEGHDSGAQELHQSMTKGSQEMQSMEMSGNLDRDFVQGMVMHHRQAIDMAKIQLEHGRDAKAREFAKKIVDAQTKEISQLERWLKANPDKGGDK